MNPANAIPEYLPLGSAGLPDAGFALARYWRYWYLFALGVLLAGVGAWLYLRYTTPLYSISSLVLIKDRRDNASSARPEQFDYVNSTNTAKNIDNEVIMLKSVSLMQRVLTEVGMGTSYYVKGKVRNQETHRSTLPFQLLIQRLDSTAFDQSITVSAGTGGSFILEEAGKAPTTYQFGQLVRRPYGAFTIISSPAVTAAAGRRPIIIKFQDVRKLALVYTRKLNVVPVNKQASVLSLTLTDAVPEKGKELINRLVEVYNKEGVEDKNAIAANTIEFIDNRLKYLGQELSSVEKGVETFKRRNEVADVGTQISQSLSEVSDYNKQVDEYGVQITVLESIEQYISKEGNQQQLIPSTSSVQDPTLASLITRFNELQLDRERMLRTAQADNPVVENMSEQLANLRVNIQESIGTIKTNLTAARRRLQAKSGESGSRMQRVPTIERGLQEINRQQELKRSLYLYLLQKREEAALSLAANVSNARIIDPANAGDEPASPQKPAVLVLALLLGLGLPFAFVYLKSLLDTRVQQPQEVAWATGAPVLGELAHSKTSEQVVISKTDRGPLAEMFRLIRTNFQFATAGQPNKVVLVTSSMSGEGKTFISLNLAASLVLAGKSVVLVNLDLRKPDLAEEASSSGGQGIAEYLLSDDVSINNIVYASAQVPGLYRINAGRLPANPAEMLMSPRLAKALTVLKESFDHIILDSSPVGQVADAFALVSYLDYTVYVVRYNFTRKAQLDTISQIQFDKKLFPLALVLNDARKNNLLGYGGYGYQQEKTQRRVG